MEPIRLVAFDLDGTVLPMGQTEPSQSFCRAVAEAAAQGVTFAIFTGRAISTIPPVLLELPGVQYLCYNNGAGVVSWPENQILFTSKMRQKLALQALDILSDYPVVVQIYNDDKLVMLREVVQHYQEYSLFPHHISAILRGMVTPVDSLRDYLLDGGRAGVDKLNVVRAEGPMRTQVLDRLLVLPAIAIVSSGNVNLEINMQGTHKGQALAFLARHSGISLEQIMALGDNDNDAEMLAVAGLGVAMADGSPNARAAADVLTSTLAEDGAAQALWRYVLAADTQNATV